MKTHRQTTHSASDAPRRGAMLIMMLLAVMIFLIMAAFSIDVAYMQMTRTDLRAATDAAAKAGASTLSRTRDEAAAIQAALDFAAANTVGGRPLILEESDIEIGNSTLQPDGSWQFTPGNPPTSVRVTALMSDVRTTGAVPLFFGSVFGVSDFTPQRISTATYFDQEVCLVIDRSHSMCFDLSGESWSYPDGTPRVPDPLAFPPHSSESRWAALEVSISQFLSIVGDVSPSPRLSLVTWASEMDNSTYEYRLTGLTSPAVRFDVPLSLDYSAINSAIHQLGSQIMIGGTNMRGGLNAGVDVLTGPDVRDFSKKTIVLMSDGQWNTGGSPIAAAQQARQDDIVVHTISFLDGADQSTMIRIADITGGRHYFASDADSLQQAFEDLARLLPATLTD